MRTYNFQEDLKFGQTYERNFAMWLQKHGAINVELNTPDEQGQKQQGGYDVRTAHDTYEIKADRWMQQTGNICIETYSCVYKDENDDIATRTSGWFYTIKAKWLIVFFNEFEFIGMPVKHLHDRWIDKPTIWRRIEIKQKGGYYTINWLAAVTPENFPQMVMGDIRK